MPGQPLITLGGPALEIRVPVPEREIAPDAVGFACTFEARIDAPVSLPMVRHGQTMTVAFRLQSVSA